MRRKTRFERVMRWVGSGEALREAWHFVLAFCFGIFLSFSWHVDGILLVGFLLDVSDGKRGLAVGAPGADREDVVRLIVDCYQL
jgi:hypothetical protein